MSSTDRARWTSAAKPLLVILLLSSVWWAAFHRTPIRSVALPQVEFLPSSVPSRQEAQKRNWVPLRWGQPTTVDAQAGLIQPSHLALSDNGHVLVLDANDYSLKLVSSHGRIVKTTSLSPKTLRQVGMPVTTLAVGNGGAWLSSPNGNATHIASDGSTMAIQARAYKLAAVEANKVLVMEPLGSPYLFTVRSDTGIVHGRFGEFITQQSKYGIVLDGRMCVDSDTGRVFFAPNYSGFLASFSIDGSPQFVIETILNEPLPTPGGATAALKTEVRPRPRVAALQVSQSALYVLMRAPGVPDLPPTFVDVYDANNGLYEYSVATPAPFNTLVVAASVVYAGESHRVTIWPLDFAAARRSGSR